MKKFRARQLVNGFWIAEVKSFFQWKGIGISGHFTWYPCESSYRECVCETLEKALDAAAAKGASEIDIIPAKTNPYITQK